jgi:hypothetical protein
VAQIQRGEGTSGWRLSNQNLQTLSAPPAKRVKKSPPFADLAKGRPPEVAPTRRRFLQEGERVWRIFVWGRLLSELKLRPPSRNCDRQRGQCPLSTDKRTYYVYISRRGKEYLCRCSPAWGGIGRSGGWCGRGLRHERASPQFCESGPARNHLLHIVLDRGGPTYVQLAGHVRAPILRRRPISKRR